MKIAVYLFVISLLYSLSSFAGEKKMASQKSGPSRVHPSEHPMLMIDMTNVQENNGITLTVCEADKYPGNPILKPGKPGAVDDEACQMGSVIYDNGKFRMWYMSVNKENKRNCGYAESEDGLSWTKPVLNMKKFKGSSQNNLVASPPNHIPFVYLDKRETDPAKLYKMAVCKGSPKGGTGRAQLWSVAYSPDGFKWKLQKNPFPPSKWEDGEAQMLVRLADKWMVITQGFSKYGRTCFGFSSKTLKKPVCEWKKKSLLTLRDKYGRYQTHQGLSIWERGSLILGFTGIFCSRVELEDTTCDLSITLSHDGLKWVEPWPLATIIRRGPQGSWDSSFIIQAFPGIMNVKDKTYIYYTGGCEGNTIATKQVGLATLRRDGFGYVGTKISWSRKQPGPRKSDFTTIPVKLNDKSKEKILLNADNLNKDQFIQIELLDENGKVIPGYSKKDCDVIQKGGLSFPVKWNGKASLESLNTNTIQIKAYLTGGRNRIDSPRIYAIYFNKQPEIEQ